MRFSNRGGIYVLDREGEEGPDETTQDHFTSAYWRERMNPGWDINSNQPHFGRYSRDAFIGLNKSEKMATVRSNKEGFTPIQVKAAEAARSAMHIVGAPDIKNIKYAIRGGLFKNCPITEEAINHAEEIYGPDGSTLKGKSTRPTTKKAVDDWIAVPELELCIDMMYVNNAAFLNGIDKTIRFRNCVPVQGRSAETLREAVDVMLRKYNNAGFEVSKLHADREFVPLTNEMLDEMNVELVPTIAGQHEPHVERANRTVKERMRVQHARLPFAAIPKIMTEYLGRTRAELMNYFPAKNGVSKHFSPHQIVEQRNVNFGTDCVAEFGAYVHAIGGKSKNTMAPRTTEGLYLKPSTNKNEGHHVLNIHTWRVISCPKVKVLPITDQVVQKVNNKAYAEGVTTLKMYNKKGDLEFVQDADQIEGVDDTEQGYAEEAFDRDYVPHNQPEDDNDVNLGRFYNYNDEDPQDVDDLMEEGVDLAMDNIEHLYNNDEEAGREYILRGYEYISPQNEDDEDDDVDDDRDDDDFDRQRDEPEDGGTPGDLVTDLEAVTDEQIQTVLDRQDVSVHFDEEDDEDTEVEEVFDEPVAEEADEVPIEEPSVSDPDRKTTRSGKAYAQVKSKSYAQALIEGKPSSRSDKKKNNRCAIRKKKRTKKLQGILKNKIEIKQKGRKKRSKQERHNLCFAQITQKGQIHEYDDLEGLVTIRNMMQIRDKMMNAKKGSSFMQQYHVSKGLKVFGKKGEEGVITELDQMLKRDAFGPVLVSGLNEKEREQSVDSMMLLAQKTSGEVKGRFVGRGDQSHDFFSKEDTASPTVSQDGIEATCTIDAYEGRDMMSMDVPNAFIQTHTPKGEDRIIMKITGVMVKYLIDIAPEYRDFVVMENGKRLIYVEVHRAIYGLLVSSLLWYKQFRGDLEGQGFIFNPYDPCIANKMVDGKQHTIRFHVDDLLSSHIDPKVNDRFADWLNLTYGQLKPCTIVRGKVHKYLGMTLDFRTKGKLKIRMDEYVQNMLDEFPIKFAEAHKQATPAGNDLMRAGTGNLLDKKKRECFHSFVAKGLFLSKRARLDVHQTIAVLSSRVREPKESDWSAIVRFMRYLHSTKFWHKTLSAEDLKVMKWWIDASFAVHPDFKSHTGSVMSMGSGAAQVMSRKQKLVSRSSTEAELIAVDDVITMVLWTKLFLECQGYPIEKNILYQDNKSAILLETNGRKSAGKRSRALNIRYFFITDQVELGNVQIEHCPTDDMIGDFMTKPLQGEKFRKFRDLILGEQD